MNHRRPISVLTPVYNAENYIVESVESILNQSFKDFEYILLDDASTDNTPQIIKTLALKDSRIKFITNEKNLYIAGNRNKALSLATGEYIVWQDADDISLLSRLEKQYEFMEKHLDVGICGSYLEFFSQEEGTTGVREYATSDKELRSKIFRYSPVAQPSAIIRKSVLDKVGDYDLSMPPAEDLDMSFRIGMVSKFANIPEVLVKYREHPSSATFKKLRTIEKHTLRARFKYFKKGYKMTVIDVLYNIAQIASLYMLPPKIRIHIFRYFRDRT